MRVFGIYIHTPYCLQKCPYCDFATVGVEDPPTDAFLSALVEEIRAFPARAAELDLTAADRFLGAGAQTVYLGGGTPSLLPAAAVETILTTLADSFGIAEDAEITLEANPGTQDAARFAAYRGLGVNRLSIGVQSLHDDVLKSLGRVHDAQAARDAVDAARTAGFDNVSIDLIFAVPGMTLDAWRQGVDEALALRPDHVSAYNLTVEPATPLAGEVKAGRVVLPPEDNQLAMYEHAVERLAAAGLPRYEISNFASPARRSRHNSLYWSYDDYLAFGPSAHAFARRGAGGIRWWNDKNPARYLQGPVGLGGREELAGRQAMGEYAFLALRTSDGISGRAFADTFGSAFQDVFAAALPPLIDAGLLERNEDQTRLTPRGFTLADTVFTEFVSGS